MGRQFIIFDFDGTIANTPPHISKIVDQLAGRFGYKNIKGKDIVRLLRKEKIQEIFKKFKISVFKLPFVVKRVRLELNKDIESVKPERGIKAAILKLRKMGYGLGILSSNSKVNVSRFLRKNKLDFFDFIYSGSSIFGKDKTIKNLLRKRHLKPEEIIYVGDETRDIEAARKIKIKIIAVTWGFNSKSLLKKEKPDFLVDKPSEIIRVVTNLFIN